MDDFAGEATVGMSVPKLLAITSSTAPNWLSANSGLGSREDSVADR
jgi:hypothetical protein